MRGHYRNAVRFKKAGAGGAFALEWQLLQYGERMLEKIELNEPLLIFLFGLLSKRESVAALRYTRRRTVERLKIKPSQLPEFRWSVGVMDAEDFSREIMACMDKCKSAKLRMDLENYLKACITRARKSLPKREQVSCCYRVADLKRVFSLTEEEILLLTVALCYSLSSNFESFCDKTNVQRKRELISVLTDLPLNVLSSLAGRDGRLIRTGILDVPDPWGDGKFYIVVQGIRDHLIGMGNASLLHKYATPAGVARYAPERFGLPEDAVRIIMGLLRTNAPCSILVHGVPGTGKTEFSKAVAASCCKQAYFVAHTTGTDFQSGRVAVEAVTTAHLADRFVVVVDEADELLNLHNGSSSGSSGKTKDSLSGKSWLNDFLDRCQAQVIWITNEVESIDESTMRRFAYNIPFRRQSARRRQEVWQEHLQENPLQQLVAAEDVADMARKFRVGAAGIANALANTARIVPVGSADKTIVLGTLRELLASHERLTGGGTDEKLVGLTSQYDPGAVCTDVPAEGIVAGLKACAARRRADRPAANLLFWGPPGTGKSAFAQYLAQSLDKELLIRRASDLLSMYVGGTEHNIREAFEQASHEDAILLLDEADSFFIDRTRAQRSWETSQTNELLTQMENHHGILICCTNLLDSLDHAVLRRFAWKVRFQAPTAEGRQRIYRRYFDAPENPIPAECLERVGRIDHLTPGDMKAVWVRFRFRPSVEWNHAEIVQALTEEVAYRGQKRVVTGFQCQTQT